MKQNHGVHIPILNLDQRGLVILVHALFSGWMLSFLFEGRILYGLMDLHGLSPDHLIFLGIAFILSGLLSSGYFIHTQKKAKQLFLWSYPLFIICSLLFFLPPSPLWTLAIIAGSFLAGCCVASWGFFLKSSTPKNERIKTIADMLILSNICMTVLNLVTVQQNPKSGLVWSIAALLAAFLLALKLPAEEREGAEREEAAEQTEDKSDFRSLLAFLSLFIILITINSGLMYQVMVPAFAHLESEICWQWAIPYIAALFVVRNLPAQTNRTYLLYVAIAMIGLSFISFVALTRTILSYYVVNVLMLFACGIYDLFWWSILGEILEYRENPGRILGIGLGANVLGIFLGGLVGRFLQNADLNISLAATLLALTVVCITLALLPLLQKRLAQDLKDHVYLGESLRASEEEPEEEGYSAFFKDFSKREIEVAERLLQGKTYQMIASELFISENTVKYHVKHIYSKLNVQSRSQLIEMVESGEV